MDNNILVSLLEQDIENSSFLKEDVGYLRDSIKRLDKDCYIYLLKKYPIIGLINKTYDIQTCIEKCLISNQIIMLSKYLLLNGYLKNYSFIKNITTDNPSLALSIILNIPNVLENFLYLSPKILLQYILLCSNEEAKILAHEEMILKKVVCSIFKYEIFFIPIMKKIFTINMINCVLNLINDTKQDIKLTSEQQEQLYDFITEDNCDLFIEFSYKFNLKILQEKIVRCVRNNQNMSSKYVLGKRKLQ